MRCSFAAWMEGMDSEVEVSLRVAGWKSEGNEEGTRYVMRCFIATEAILFSRGSIMIPRVRG